MTKKILLASVILMMAAVVLSGCGSTDYDELGATCTENSACEDVCHTGFPGGVCTTSCDADNPCEEGVCVTFSDGGWCLPECEDNSECRDGYSCILGACRPVSEASEPCDDGDDCGTDLSCLEGMCTHTCSSILDCDDMVGTYCTTDASSTGLWCLPPISDPNLGVSCFVPPVEDDELVGKTSDATCAENYVCYPDPSNMDAYCTTACKTDRDCLPNMACREVSTANGLVSMCVRREYCEPCNTDDECGSQYDRCIGSEPSKSSENFCSTNCDPNEPATCPTDSTCKQVYFCTTRNAWVPDCSWCDGECKTDGPSVFECVPDYGACTGNGSLCSPCRTQEECQNGDGGYCLTSLDNAFCTKPCTSDTECPEGYICYDIGASQKQCIPGNTSCTNPQAPQQ